MPYYRSDQARIDVTVTGAANLDKLPWDMMEGGDPVAEEVQVFPGGMQPHVSVGGLAKWSPVVVERAWSEVLAIAYAELANGVGQAPATVAYTLLGSGKLPVGPSWTYVGVLIGAERPKYKATESVEAFLKLTVAINGAVAGS